MFHTTHFPDTVEGDLGRGARACSTQRGKRERKIKTSQHTDIVTRESLDLEGEEENSGAAKRKRQLLGD